MFKCINDYCINNKYLLIKMSATPDTHTTTDTSKYEPKRKVDAIDEIKESDKT